MYDRYKGVLNMNKQLDIASTPYERALAVARLHRVNYELSKNKATTIKRIFKAINNKLPYVTWFAFCKFIDY